MTKFILEHFVKEKEDISKKRSEYATCASIVGMIANLGLFAGKLAIGLLAKSMAVISDAFNNLSDCLSFFISFFGFRMANRPADKEHPFGHGRIEYLISLIVVVLIFFVGFEFLTESIKRIQNPVQTNFSWIMFVVLLLTVAVKIWLSHFLGYVGKESNNLALIATSQDSKNDVFITLVAIIALILSSQSTEISYDGIAGVLVSLFIFYSGYGLAKETFMNLLGTKPEGEVVDKVNAIIKNNKEVLGVHDLIIHDYGPNVRMGSAHVEVKNTLGLEEAHSIVDNIEKEVMNQCNISLTLHVDPVDVSDAETNELKEMITTLIKEKNASLSVHDFHLDKDTQTIGFDIALPLDETIDENEIKEYIQEKLKEKNISYACDITFDEGYVAKR